ncbi:MAG: hypothetical protein K0V04_15635, partial [Deltaproteobacteria bacterium]|nr:hypothetical protein [Deltaproteobacteria bacterium]
MKKRTAAGLWAVLGCGLVLMGTTACNHTKTSPTATPTLGAEDSEATVIRLEQEYAEAYGYAGRLARVEWHVRDYLDDHPDDPRALALLAEVL